MNIESIKDIINTLKDNGLSLNTKITTTCIYGHKYSVKMDDFNECPLCLKYTSEHIAKITADRRNSHTLRVDIFLEDKIIPCAVYIVKLRKDDEEFYKIGYSVKGVKERLIECPYELIEHKSIFTCLAYAKVIERHLHLLHDEFSYLPKIGFDGCSECFIKVRDDIDKILNDINLERSKVIYNLLEGYFK